MNPTYTNLPSLGGLHRMGRIHPVMESGTAEADFTPAMTTGSFLDALQKAAQLFTWAVSVIVEQGKPEHSTATKPWPPSSFLSYIKENWKDLFPN